MDFNLTEEQLILQRSAREFTTREIEPVAVKIDRDGRLPDDLIGKLGRLGWLGMTVPHKYGGSGSGSLNCALVIEQIAYSGTGAWWLVAFNNSIPGCIVQFGSEELKIAVVKSFCEGKAYASIQFTEEETGSDPKLLKTSAVPEGNHYVINGSKRLSTFAARDGFAVVYTRDEMDGCTAIVIPKMTKGYEVQKQWELMGGGGIESADVIFNNVRAPLSMMLGEKGDGFAILLYWIALEKIYQCSAGVGVAQAALDEAVSYAEARHSGGKPIGKMQGIKWMLADMYSKLEAARYLTYRAACLYDRREVGWESEAAVAKLFVIPAVLQIVDTARQIHGSYGYTKGVKIERLYRAAAGATGIATSMEINRTIAGDRAIEQSGQQ
jgi:butyryl-CoA dehydrogenase